MLNLPSGRYCLSRFSILPTLLTAVAVGILNSSIRAEPIGHEHKPADEASAEINTNAPCLEASVAASYTPAHFAGIFVTPAGPAGMEYTTNLLNLRNKPVCMTGFMVRHVNKNPSVFMMTEYPVSTMEHEYGVADSVPPNVVHVLLPEQDGLGTAWQPYAVTVYGELQLGRREEMDGRVSFIRIKADFVTVGTNNQLLKVMLPLAEREINLGPHHHDH